jgi:hypothetical protein
VRVIGETHLRSFAIAPLGSFGDGFMTSRVGNSAFLGIPLEATPW